MFHFPQLRRTTVRRRGQKSRARGAEHQSATSANEDGGRGSTHRFAQDRSDPAPCVASSSVISAWTRRSISSRIG